jgi:hypothetical protein
MGSPERRQPSTCRSLDFRSRWSAKRRQGVGINPPMVPDAGPSPKSRSGRALAPPRDPSPARPRMSAEAPARRPRPGARAKPSPQGGTARERATKEPASRPGRRRRRRGGAVTSRRPSASEGPRRHRRATMGPRWSLSRVSGEAASRGEPRPRLEPQQTRRDESSDQPEDARPSFSVARRLRRLDALRFGCASAAPSSSLALVASRPPPLRAPGRRCSSGVWHVLGRRLPVGR